MLALWNVLGWCSTCSFDPRRTEEKLQTVKNTHGKDIEGEIIPLVGDVTKKDSVEYVIAISSMMTRM